MAGFPPVQQHRPEALTDMQIGRIPLLVEENERTASSRTRDTANCRVLDELIEHTRGHVFLGQAREALGDTAGACAAYRVVIDRWGIKAKKSRTLDKARARFRALACKDG